MIFIIDINGMQCLTQGKTDKEKAKDKAKGAEKGKLKDKVPKVLKAGGSGSSGKGKKKVIIY